MILRIFSRIPGLIAALACCALAAFDDPWVSPKEVRADFCELYRRLQESHYDLFARRDKAAYDRLHAQMLAGFRHRLRRSQVLDAFQRFMAFGRIAHARMDEPDTAFEAYRAAGGAAFPLQLRVVQGRVYVAANLSGLSAVLPGDELLSLDGRPVPQVLRAFGRFLSADNDYLLQTLAENDSGRLLWRLLGPRSAFSVSLRRAGGAPYRLRLPARSRGEMTAELNRLPKGLALDWIKREARVLPGGVAYLRPGPFFNAVEGATDPWDATDFNAFVDGTFERFIREGAGKLIIDLRDNPGGDNSFSDRMVAWFATKPFSFTSEFRIKVSAATTASNAARLEGSPEGSISHRFAEAYARHQPGETFRFEIPATPPRSGPRYQGKVFLLVNRHSYSNTATVAALAQDEGFAVILGEETADLASTYGAMEHFRLSRTGFKVGYPKALILRPSGDRSPRGVVPDLPIPTPVVQSADDPVLQKALEAVNGWVR